MGEKDINTKFELLEHSSFEKQKAKICIKVI